jgi:hypothetical protein
MKSSRNIKKYTLPDKPLPKTIVGILKMICVAENDTLLRLQFPDVITRLASPPPPPPQKSSHIYKVKILFFHSRSTKPIYILFSCAQNRKNEFRTTSHAPPTFPIARQTHWRLSRCVIVSAVNHSSPFQVVRLRRDVKTPPA